MTLLTPGDGARLFTLVRYMLAAAMRDRLFLGMPLMLALAAGLSIFIGASAIVEQPQMIAAYIGAMSRAILISGIILFVSFNVRRALDNGEVSYILSRPISRAAFILAYSASLMIVASICALFAAILVAAGARPSPAGFIQWAGSLLLEVNLMAIAALFFSINMGSAVSSALACFGFYVLARMSGLLGALALQAGSGSLIDQVLGRSFEIVSLLIPRLDFFTRTEWLVYGAGDTRAPLYAVLQSLVFIPLLLAAAIFDFNRKRF